jgi:hypothetical protein
MNHKRKRPKHQRSGCLMCKWFKDERTKKRIHIRGRKGKTDLRSIED